MRMENFVNLTASELYLYPVKSCAPVRVDSLVFDQEGLVVGDREWVIVDAQSGMVWQGSHPKLALVRPQLHDGILTLHSPDGEQADVEMHPGSASQQIRTWNDVAKKDEFHSGVDGGDSVAAFLQRTVGAQLRLVRLSKEALRREGTNTVHVVSRSSYQEFLDALAPAEKSVASVMRFRPNIVVTGSDESLMPFLEEQFTELEWGSGASSARLTVGALCVRCIVPNVDPATGLVDESVLGVVSTLSAQRHPGHPTYFGIYARSTGPGTLVQGTELAAKLAF